MNAFESRWFKRWSKKNGLKKADLLDALERTINGSGVVNLGGNIYKIRVAKNGQGRSGGFRTILIFKKGKRSLFIYGFEKNDQDNIDKGTLADYKKFAVTFLNYTDDDINRLVNNGTISLLEEK
ncbi:MAG TPA: type II toxin-antitoxin system RelE/ParE family toxin [Fibrobacteraceae bacterium]|jgi:hypothetical protein|nr:type II toxin-antitoxin system RelE/ParE family toxin [Fibrobacteraceae bacterium]HQB65038.1 type II toxin-antitoxin system RelE/ParE family toxin [Fibrobacteraceae bacterium]